MKLLFENWREYLNEKKEEKEEESVKILMPPTDLKALRSLIVKDTSTDPDGKMTFAIEKGKKEKRGTPEEWVKSLPDAVLPHEAIHAMQARDMPELFAGSLEGAGALSGGWDEATDKQKEKYFSVPAEIMAFAYDYAANITSLDASPEETYEEYEKIGGEVFEKFKKYVEAYKKRLGTDK